MVKRIKNNEILKQNLVDKSVWFEDEYVKILLDIDNEKFGILEKLNFGSKKFSEIAEIIWGIKPYQVGHGIPIQTKEMLTERIYHSAIQLSNDWKPLVVGSNVNRYFFDTKKIEYIFYGKNLMYPSNVNKINEPKILMRQTSDLIRCVIDYDNFYPQNSLFIISVLNKSIDLKYLMSLLNSKLINFIYGLKNPQKGKTFAEIKPSVIKGLPIKEISLAKQKPFIQKAEEMLSLNQELQTLNGKFTRNLEREFTLTKPSKKLQDWHNLTYTDFIKELTKQKITLTLAQKAEWEDYFLAEQTKAQTLQTKIHQTDQHIDQMVYQLYGLTDDEIAIIEGAG